MMFLKSPVFIKNAFVMTVTATILRLAGMVFKIWLANRVGAEGIGLYQIIFSVYVFAAAFASSGICTAVTAMVASDERFGRRAVKRVMNRSFLLTAVVSLISAAALSVLAVPISKYALKDMRAVLSLRVLSLSLPFMGLSACIRGYFIARKNAAVPSAVQIAEQAVRIAVSVGLITAFANSGAKLTTAAIFAGDTAAEFIAFVIIAAAYSHNVKKIGRGGEVPRHTLKKMLSIAVPITAGKYLTIGMKTIENIAVPTLLGMFYRGGGKGLALFGALKGMAIPILFFPSSLLSSVSTLLIPELTRDGTAGGRKTAAKKCETVITVTLISSVMTAACFLCEGARIGELVYGDTATGYIIKVLSPLVPFMYLESVCDGILKGLGEQNYSFKYNAADSALRIAAMWFLIPRFGMSGFLGVMIVSNVLTSSLCVSRIVKVGGIHIDVTGAVVKPLIAAALGYAAGYFASRAVGGEGVARTVVGVAAVCVTFLFVTVITRKGERIRRP